MCVPLEMRVEDLQGLRGEAGAPLPLLSWLVSHELRQGVLAVLVPIEGRGRQRSVDVHFKA